jgi:hypothetical protein
MKRVLIIADLHSGHQVGLTHPKFECKLLGEARMGGAWLGPARRGNARQGLGIIDSNTARHGRAWRGAARWGRAWRGGEGQGKGNTIYVIKQGNAGHGAARQGRARQGGARQCTARRGVLSKEKW